MKTLTLFFRATLLLILLTGTALSAAAYDFESGGIYYNITSSTNMTVAVTYKSKTDNTYSGNVTIPSSVSNNGKTYYVTAIGDYAFVGCSGLSGITISSNRTTSIGSYAFQGCNGMTTFTVPAQITSIGNYAFNACYGLTKVIFNATTNAISLGYGSSQGSSHGLFEDCELTYVKIDRPLSYNTSSSYGYSPFAWQPALTQVVLGQNVTSIPANLFYGNSAITSYTVPSHIKSIDDYAFNGFTGAKKITLNEGTERISNYAFNGCSSLTSFTIPSTVTSIGQNAFSYSAIKTIVIPPAVTSIGNYAFNGCTALTGVTIEESEEVLALGYSNYHYYSSDPAGKGLFYDSPLNSVFIGRKLSYDTSEAKGYSPFAKVETLKKAWFGNPVTSIQSYLFFGCKLLTTLEYNTQCAPTEIGNYAFCGCTSLTESCIVYPSSVKSIGEGAFKGCTSLLAYTIPNHVLTVGNSAFQNCEKLKNIVIKSNMKSIGNYAFNGCTALTGVTIEEGEEVLSLGYGNYHYYSSDPAGKGLFYDSPLKSVFIGRKLSYDTSEAKGYSPFAKNDSIVKARFGNPVTSIQSYLFYGCPLFTTLEYNSQSKPTVIENYAFAGCKKLLSIDIPSTVKSIGEGAFKNCIKLSNIVIKPAVTSIGNYAFNGCTALTGVTIEESEEVLALGYSNYHYYSSDPAGKGLFYDSPLNSVFIGRKLSYDTGSNKGYSPFANIENLTKARLGKKLSSISDYLFYGCIHLTEVTSCPTTPPTVGSNVFATYDATLYVPKGSVSAYKNANVWKNFYSIVGTDIVDAMPGDTDGDGKINIDDVTALINYLLTGNTSSINTTNADVDGNGKVNIDDVTALINYLLSGHF